LAADFDGVRPATGTVADTHVVENYHRPISRMITDILATGFTIKKLVEPQLRRNAG